MTFNASKTTAITILGMALFSWAWAQDDVIAKRVFGNGVLSEHLSMYDVNEDGTLSVEEYQVLKADRTSQRSQVRTRSRWDRNRDGQVDARERQFAIAEIRKMIEQRRLRRFNEVDLDSDRHLTLREFLQINAVASTDLNKPGTGEEIFKHIDRNEDTLISQEEFLVSLDKVRPVAVPQDNSKPRPEVTEVPADRPVNRLDRER